MPKDINTNVPEEHNINVLKKNIKAVLRRYFEVDDNGNPNPTFDENFTAQDAIDEIHGIVGDI